MSIVKFIAKPKSEWHNPVKSKCQVYQRALKRFTETVIEEHEEDNLDVNQIQKFIFLNVKIVATSKRVGDEDNILLKMQPMERYAYLDSIVQTIGLLTPKQLIEVFPIHKTYDGDKYQMKDYFYTKEEINKIGVDSSIGNKSFELLWDYENNDLRNFLVETVSAMNLVNMYRGGVDAWDYILNNKELPKERNKPQIPKYLQLIK